MSLFDFLKNKNAKQANLLEPAVCSNLVDARIVAEIDGIDWKQYGTAYGDAENTVPCYLKNMFCSDEQAALEATHQLWCSICYQGVNMADAALPAYEILRIGLVQLSDELKAEILDIFSVFALCTSKEYITVPNELAEWEKQVQAKLLRDKPVFKSFELNNDKYLSGIAKIIYNHLDNQKI